MNRIYSVVFFPVAVFFFQVDCNGSFTCKPLQASESGEYSLALELHDGVEDNYSLELYDLTTGDLVEKKSVFFKPGSEKVVFNSLKPSTYMVYYSSGACSQKKSILGKGIILQ
ncbi:MAG TPA: hypothetical protein PK185_09850 [Cyclobacteriaceae bacterium]|jgi:hypothetical protein|nr:hypothetical protein [Cyclobacteriaceae bacterium]HRK54207.1 hypothetical protein [Cyclobacteriaceae bacterium]